MKDVDVYQLQAISMAIYPGAHSEESTVESLAYCALGLTGEAGEVAEKVKKLIRDQGCEITEGFRTKLIRELGDVIWYVSALANELGFSMSEVLDENIKKCLDRKARDVLHGCGDDR